MTTMLEQSQAFEFERNSSTHATAANSFTATEAVSDLFIFWEKPTSSCL